MEERGSDGRGEDEGEGRRGGKGLETGGEEGKGEGRRKGGRGSLKGR